MLKRDPSLLNWAGRFSGALLVLGIIGFFLGRVYRRRVFCAISLPRVWSPKS
jgi:hypothetical protein